MESGDKRARAQERLNRFVNEVMPKAWDYVKGRKPRSGDPTPEKRVKSTVAKVVHPKQAKRESYKENQPGKSKENTSSISPKSGEKKSVHNKFPHHSRRGSPDRKRRGTPILASGENSQNGPNLCLVPGTINSKSTDGCGYPGLHSCNRDTTIDRHLTNYLGPNDKEP